MKWPWRRDDREQARRGLAESRADLERARRVGEEVTEVAAELRALRRRNRFGPMITEALRGPR